ncbi:DNA methyltransferase [Spirochaetia bacterium]|nr:DNA methyltransferase [Spirochaetia bacterium]
MAAVSISTTSINQYIAEVNKIYQSGNGTEHSYRPALKSLLEAITSGLTITNEPKRIDCGAPDYIVAKNDIPVGYIEAKDIPVGIHSKENEAQFKRYKHSLNNLIITDYINFELFIDGNPAISASIGSVDGRNIKNNKSQYEAFFELVQQFVGYEGKTIADSGTLASMMAAKARLLSAIIESAIPSSENELLSTDGDALVEQLKVFRQYLIHNLSPKEFADIFAQTIAYGMFAARLNDKTNTPFTRDKAAKNIPGSNPFLKDFFRSIAAFELDERICWIIDALADIFNCVAIEDLLKEFSKANQDPYINFYETFLGEFDPSLRKCRGVWYTPVQVVQFIVDAVDDILKTEFNLQAGLADKSSINVSKPCEAKTLHAGGEEIKMHKVQILDPATGTGTFLAAVIDKIHEKFLSNEGMWDAYCTNDLIPRLHGFEILMASYAMAHFKLDMKLKETGYQNNKERLRVFLTNTLEYVSKNQPTLPFAHWLETEAKEARKIKRDVPVMVVLGNPPYSGESSNKTSDDFLSEYKKEPAPNLNREDKTDKLQERNSKWLNDDYVKFIRFGQLLVHKNKNGVLAFINNHSFLDNPTFRGMRYNLLKTFDKIYILDLHGNSKKKETAPGGGKDENVFDIMQGVSINIFIKTETAKDNEYAQVFHYDLYGARETKYTFLLENNLSSTKWKELKPAAPYFFFTQKKFSGIMKYKNGISIPDLFPKNSCGIVSARDEFTIHTTVQSLKNTINTFLKLDDEAAREKFNLGKDVQDWSVAGAREDLVPDKDKKAEPDFKKIVKIDYRPFDVRWTFYTGNSKGFHCRSRGEIMQHFMNGGNIGIMVCRQHKTGDFSHCLIHSHIIESSYVSNITSEIGTSFPLYLYDQDTENNSDTNRRPNLNIKIIEQISSKTGLHYTTEKEGTPNTFAPIDVLDYIYAVLHSPEYRETCKEFLKIDFPRVPYPANADQFNKLVALGATLREYHLLDGVAPTFGMATYPIKGSNEIEKQEYKNGNVYINKTQYFQNVPQEAWNFFIGGYQPAQKWLKDRKGQTITDGIEHYQKIITALYKTYEIQGHIDGVLGNK